MGDRKRTKHYTEKQRLSNTNLKKMGVNSGSPEEKGKAVLASRVTPAILH